MYCGSTSTEVAPPAVSVCCEQVFIPTVFVTKTLCIPLHPHRHKPSNCNSYQHLHDDITRGVCIPSPQTHGGGGGDEEKESLLKQGRDSGDKAPLISEPPPPQTTAERRNSAGTRGRDRSREWSSLCVSLASKSSIIILFIGSPTIISSQ